MSAGLGVVLIFAALAIVAAMVWLASVIDEQADALRDDIVSNVGDERRVTSDE